MHSSCLCAYMSGRPAVSCCRSAWPTPPSAVALPLSLVSKRASPPTFWDAEAQLPPDSIVLMSLPMAPLLLRASLQMEPLVLLLAMAPLLVMAPLLLEPWPMVSFRPLPLLGDSRSAWDASQKSLVDVDIRVSSPRLPAAGESDAGTLGSAPPAAELLILRILCCHSDPERHACWITCRYLVRNVACMSRPSLSTSSVKVSSNWPMKGASFPSVRRPNASTSLSSGRRTMLGSRPWTCTLLLDHLPSCSRTWPSSFTRRSPIVGVTHTTSPLTIGSR
mmetsp:Transcript_50468/g.133962  ORF Transcript_50468/g.133962 Transcript_50468/m.133962 type:complete len:277 (+) Transcript_50468:121-951(+)